MFMDQIPQVRVKSSSLALTSSSCKSHYAHPERDAVSFKPDLHLEQHAELQPFHLPHSQLCFRIRVFQEESSFSSQKFVGAVSS